MASLNFFAVRQDMVQLFDFIFEETDVHVFGPHPQDTLTPYRYKNLKELLSNVDLGLDITGNGYIHEFCLWSPSVFRSNIFFRMLNRFPQDRYSGPGVIQLRFGGIYKNQIMRSHFGHFSEEGAKSKGIHYSIFGVHSCNWNALNTLSDKIQEQIKYKQSFHHVPGHPILKGAYKEFQKGLVLKENKFTIWEYNSDKTYDT